MSRHNDIRAAAALVLAVCLGVAALAPREVQAAGPGKADPSERIVSSWPPEGEPAKFPINRDVWISSAGKEAVGNNGGAPKWKLKGVQEYTLFDADLAGLKGRLVTGALLHVRCASPAEPALRVSIATVATPWVEGTGTGYAEQRGSACYNSPELGSRQWAFPGSTILDATWGKGNTIWRFAEASAPDKDGWQVIPIEPDVVAANAAGLSHGFAAMDDVGSIWSYHGGGTFKFTTFPNRFFFSREQRGSAPYLEIWTVGEDKDPPDAVTELTADTAGLPAGEALVRWKTPVDRGAGKTLGFNVTYKVGDRQTPVPRHLIPMAGEAGAEVRMLIQDLPLKAGQSAELTVAAVDSCGNVGKPYTQAIRVSDAPVIFPIAGSRFSPFEPSEQLPEVGGLKVAVLDLVDKVEAKTGKMVPSHPAGYKGGNHLWSAEKKLIRLQSGRNEAVCFLVNLEGASDGVAMKLAFPEEAGLKCSVYRLDYVLAGGGSMPDAAVPLEGTLPIPNKGDPQAADQTNASLLCEVYVPHEVAAGTKTGKLTITSGGKSLDLAVDLTVWEFTLPNGLSFIPEMNCYGTAMPTGAGLEYYRVAHEHRTCLNRLYYGWNGSVRDGAAPQRKGGGFDWTEYDETFGPLFDGSAFADLPRKGEPVDLFYLPFNEHWPMDMYSNYRKSYWADEAYTDAYKNGFRKACAEFAAHFNEKKWHNTIFEFYLNNKVYHKDKRPYRSVAAAWCMDEPANFQDFWALRWYGILYHQGVDPVRGQAKMWFRGDVSRTQYGRDALWGVLDIEVMGGGNAEKFRMKRDEEYLWGKSYYTVYGSANNPADANTQAVVWCLSAWANGSIGVLPWQTIGTKAAWEKAEPTCLFYSTDDKKVIPSIRLKAFTRGQQDVEYLTLLGDAYAQPRFAVAAGMKGLVDLAGKITKTSEEDAGTSRFDKPDPTALWALRAAVGEMVSARKPAYKAVVRPMPSPQIDTSRLPNLGYVTVAPKAAPSAPDLDEKAVTAAP